MKLICITINGLKSLRETIQLGLSNISDISVVGLLFEFLVPYSSIFNSQLHPTSRIIDDSNLESAIV